MRLTRIRLRHFKRHETLELEPAAGLTIVRGPNEAGKSTLQQAIGLALFRKADANRDDLRRARRWGSEAPPEVQLEFEVDGSVGTLHKRFAGSRGSAELVLDGEIVQDHDRIGEIIAELTGIPSESFFRATASVGHAELAQVSGDEPEVQDRLQEAVSGSDRGTARAKKMLETAIHRYRTAGHKNPGLLKVTRAEVDMLERELADEERALQRLETDRAAWVEASDRLERAQRQLASCHTDLEEAQRAQTLASARDAAQTRYERLARAAGLLRRRDELRATAPTAVPLAQLREGVRAADPLAMEISELEAVLDAEADARGGFEPPPPPPTPTRWLLTAVALFVAAAIVWFVLGSLLGIGIAAVLSLLAVAGLVQSVRVATRRRRYGLAQRLAKATASELHETERPRRERLRALERQLEGSLASLGVDDLGQARDLLARAEQHGSELSRIEGELQGLAVEEQDAALLEGMRDQAAGEAAQASHALAAMGPLADDPDTAVREAQRQVSLITPQRDDARSEADQALGRVEANAVDAELVAGLSERLAAARDRLAEQERRAAVYEGTLAAIVAAEEATLKTAARYLEERMGPSISTITAGRYDEIEIDEKDLAFQVRVPETGELVDVKQLSQGTADQLYLTARLGLIRLLTMDRRPPLILDDPFVTFDPARGERALTLVKRVAAEQGFQVLYLTCSDRFDALADKLVVLEGPGAPAMAQASDGPPWASADDAPPVLQPATGSARRWSEPEPAAEPEPEPQPAAEPQPATEPEPEPAAEPEPEPAAEPEPEPDLRLFADPDERADA